MTACKPETTEVGIKLKIKLFASRGSVDIGEHLVSFATVVTNNTPQSSSNDGHARFFAKEALMSFLSIIPVATDGNG